MGSTGKTRPTVTQQVASVTIRTQEMEQQPNRILTRCQRAKYVVRSCVSFTGPYKVKESPLYSAFITLCLHLTSILPTSPSCGFWLCCDWLSNIAAKNERAEQNVPLLPDPFSWGDVSGSGARDITEQFVSTGPKLSLISFHCLPNKRESNVSLWSLAHQLQLHLPNT